MKISVVMPCYNAGRWISQALDSAARQTHPPHEILVIDDGSTDDSLQKIQATGLPVKLLHTKRANGAGARNAGIQAATGDWIAFLDADDLWHPNHLERATQLLQTTSDAAFMNHSDSIFESNPDAGVVHHSPPWPIQQPTTGLTHQAYLEMAATRFFFAMSACLVRREVLLAIDGLDLSQTRRHDIDMWLRAIHNHTWSYDPMPSSIYRADTPGAISRNIFSREYFFLRALLKNQKAYASPAMDRLIKVAAKRTMSAAYTDGTRKDRQQAKQLAWPHLTPRDKTLFRTVGLCPPVFRCANLLRRKLKANRRARCQ